MRTRDIWITVAVLAPAGIALLYLADQQDSEVLSWMGYALTGLPFALAVNITARRRREKRREDSVDSVEHQAAQAASARAFRAGLVIMALTMAGLAIAPGAIPALWAIAGLTATVVAFWVLYLIELRTLRG